MWILRQKYNYDKAFLIYITRQSDEVHTQKVNEMWSVGSEVHHNSALGYKEKLMDKKY